MGPKLSEHPLLTCFHEQRKSINGRVIPVHCYSEFLEGRGSFAHSNRVAFDTNCVYDVFTNFLVLREGYLSSQCKLDSAKNRSFIFPTQM